MHLASEFASLDKAERERQLEIYISYFSFTLFFLF